jgi:DNA-binding NtrC family response regulator
MFTIPPLRERKEDLPLLIEHVIANFKGNEYHEQIEVNPEAMEILFNYDWPGNIRELKNSINYACTASANGLIGVEDLPAPLRKKTLKVESGLVRQNERELITQVLQEVHFNKRKAASILGISRTTLYSKIKQYNLTMKTPHNDE